MYMSWPRTILWKYNFTAFLWGKRGHPFYRLMSKPFYSNKKRKFQKFGQKYLLFFFNLNFSTQKKEEAIYDKNFRIRDKQKFQQYFTKEIYYKKNCDILARRYQNYEGVGLHILMSWRCWCFILTRKFPFKW